MAKINRVAIYDMDGTIVCSLHRYRTMVREDGKEVIDLQYWRDNEPLAMQDSLLPMAKQYWSDLNDSHCYVIIATARVIHDADMRFIREKLGLPNYIISRQEGDSRSGGLLKVNGLQKFANLPQFKNAEWMFYEDNTDYLKKVCDHFSFSGINIKGVYIPSKQGH